MTEDAKALCILLYHIYPDTPGSIVDTFASFSDIRRGLEVSRKFQMSRLQEQLRLTLLSRVKEAAESVFAISWEYQIKDVVQAAARETLRRPLLMGGKVAEFAFIPATAVQNLLRYQRRCIDSIPKISPVLPFDPAWMYQFHQSICSSLCAFPHPDTVREPSVVSLATSAILKVFPHAIIDKFTIDQYIKDSTLLIEAKLSKVRPLIPPESGQSSNDLPDPN